MKFSSQKYTYPHYPYAWISLVIHRRMKQEYDTGDRQNEGVNNDPRKISLLRSNRSHLIHIVSQTAVQRIRSKQLLRQRSRTH